MTDQILGALIGAGGALLGVGIASASSALLPKLNHRTWKRQKRAEELLNIAQKIVGTYRAADRAVDYDRDDLAGHLSDIETTFYEQSELISIALVLSKHRRKLMPLATRLFKLNTEGHRKKRFSKTDEAAMYQARSAIVATLYAEALGVDPDVIEQEVNAALHLIPGPSELGEEEAGQRGPDVRSSDYPEC